MPSPSSVKLKLKTTLTAKINQMTYYRVFAIRTRVFLVRKSPATLLAKPALETGNDDFRAFGMALTDPVLSVVVLGPSEVDITTFNLADT